METSLWQHRDGVLSPFLWGVGGVSTRLGQHKCGEGWERVWPVTPHSSSSFCSRHLQVPEGGAAEAGLRPCAGEGQVVLSGLQARPLLAAGPGSV